MSPKDPIEELFRDNRHGLDEQPRDLLWKRIEEKLEQEPYIPHKTNWWKYTAAASLAVGISFAAYFFLQQPESELNSIQETQIVHQPAEITEENATEILNKLEENKQSVAATLKKDKMPEIYKEPEPVSEMDASPPASVLDAAPAMSRDEEKEIPVQKINDEGSIVFRGDTPEKKEKNYISQKGIDERRRGNMAESEFLYADSVSISRIQIQTQKHIIDYQLSSRDENRLVFTNHSVAFPNQIIFQKVNDSIQVLYEGKNSKKNSKESKEIQSFIRKNQAQILNDFGME